MVIRAWVVSTDWSEASIIVFATTRSEARTYARQSEWLAGGDWTDFRARRLPYADDYAVTFGLGVARWGEPLARLMWLLGWYEVGEEAETCAGCDSYVWSLVPESHLDANYLCRKCAAEIQHEKMS